MSDQITIVKGDDVSFVTTFTDENGVAIDLTGGTVFFTVKADPVPTDATDTTAVITKTVTSHTTPLSGITTITLTNTQTNVAAGTYYYDLQLKDASGKIYSTISGVFIILQGVTQRTT